MASSLNIITKPPVTEPMQLLRTYAEIVMDESGHGVASDLSASITEQINKADDLLNRGGDLMGSLRLSTHVIGLIARIAREHGFTVEVEGANVGIWVVSRDV